MNNRSIMIKTIAVFVLAWGAAGISFCAQNDEGEVNFSFDQVDIRTFVKLVGEPSGKKFVVPDVVAGKITVVSPRVKKSEVYSLFVRTLEMNGFSVVDQGGVCQIIPTVPRITPLATVVGTNDVMPQSGMVTMLLKLKYVSAGELRKALESRISGGKSGSISSVDESNHILVTDTVDAVRQIEKIVEQVDQPGLTRMTELVPLQVAGAEDIAAQLNEAVAEGESRGEQLRNRLPQVAGTTEQARKSAVVVAVPHSNSLILGGSLAQITELKRIIAKMDVKAQGRGRLNAIFLKYLAADEAAKSLNALLAKTIEKDQRTGASINKISIEAMTANNALIVNSTVGDYEMVTNLVAQLDRMPGQVHIEVMIAEVSDTDSLDLGVEMAALDMPGKVGAMALQGGSKLTEGADGLMNSIQKGLFPRGLSVGVAQGVSVGTDGKVVVGYPGAINLDAVRKTGKVKIRSRTALEAQNNKEASVNIVNQIPVLKSTIQGGSGTSRDVIQNIDRVDVGIKLKLTPYIIPGDGEVRMVLNPSIEAVIDPGPAGTQFAPTIARRDVSTTVTVRDGKTIVIAGLTREDKTKVVRKVPLLGSIPLIGILFRKTSESLEKTDLLIFVTPRIVDDSLKAEAVMKDWEKKTDLKANEK